MATISSSSFSAVSKSITSSNLWYSPLSTENLYPTICSHLRHLRQSFGAMATYKPSVVYAASTSSSPSTSDDYFKEDVISGGAHSKIEMVEAFRRLKIHQIGLLVSGSEGLDWAIQLRDCLAEVKSDTVVKIALQKGLARSDIGSAAKMEGFTKKNGTLGSVQKIAPCSDLFLFPDDIVENYAYVSVFKHMKPHSHLGLFSGLHVEHLKSLKSRGVNLPKNVNVFVIEPIRKEPIANSSQVIDKACRFAVYKDHDGNAATIAGGLAVALGSPLTVVATMDFINKISFSRTPRVPSVTEILKDDGVIAHEYNNEHSRTIISAKWSWNQAWPTMLTALSVSLAIVGLAYTSYYLYGNIDAASRSLIMPGNYNLHTGPLASILHKIKKVDIAFLEGILKMGLLMPLAIPLAIHLAKVKYPNILKAGWKELLDQFTSAKSKAEHQISNDGKPASADSSSKKTVAVGSILSIFNYNFFS